MASSPAPRASIDSLASPSPRTPLEGRQYPFPSSDGLRSTRQTPLRNPSTVSSIGGVLDSASQQGEVISEVAQNAISTLLQPPIVRTGLIPHTALPASGGYKAPTTKDIPPVTLSTIPHVDPAIFKRYLSQIGSLYDVFRRAKLDEDDNDEDEGSRLLRTRSELSQSTDGKGKAARLESPPVSPTADAKHRRRSSGNGAVRRPGKGVTPLSTIPSVYFESDFHLENPRTFDVVSERSDVVRPRSGPQTNGMNGSADPPIGRKALATNAILQEKLSWYMDTVEIHLISSISTASASFFAALGSLKELQQEAADSVKKIQDLRTKLRRLDNEVAVGGLKIVAKKRRRENVRKLRFAVQQMDDIVQRVSRCDKLLEEGQANQAMNMIEDSESLIAGEWPSHEAAQDGLGGKDKDNRTLLDLRGIPATEGAVMEIENLRLRVGKAFEARFLDASTLDLRSHVENVPVTETLQRWGAALQRSRGDQSRKPSGLPKYLSLDKELREVLSVNLNGLGRSNHLMPATTAYRDAVLKQIRSLIRRHLPSSNEDDNESVMSASTQSSRARSQQEKSSILARNLRNLDPEDAEMLLSKTYAGISESLRRLSVQTKVLLDLTSGLGSPPSSAGLRSPPMKSPGVAAMDGYLAAGGSPGKAISPGRMQNEINQALDMSSLLGQAVDIAQNQIVKILKVRSEPSIQLPLSSFLRYFMLNRLFADECEAVSGRGGSGLKSVVNNHIKDFVLNFGAVQRKELVNSMDKDRWDAVEAGEPEVQAVARVLQGFTKDAELWLRESLIWKANSSDAVNDNTLNGTQNGEKSQTIVIDEQKFILPGSAFAVLRGIDSFEHLISGIPSMTLEVGSVLLEYLKLFNSRSSQLILGAGATRSAGLKNITTKHLALASQALSFIIALIPYVREFARRHAPAATGLLGEFDKAKRLYQEHQNGIHDKLIDIMSSRASAHVSAFRKVDWTEAQDDVNDYMERLVKETSTLHRVLTKHPPEMTVSLIMNPIFSSYREQWGKAFAETVIASEAEKERLVRDAEFFQARLSKLEGSGDVGDYVVNIARSKVVVPPSTALSGTRTSAPSDGDVEEDEEEDEGNEGE